jgi:hypothetical protein
MLAGYSPVDCRDKVENARARARHTRVTE